MENQLVLGDVLSNAFKIGLKNFLSLIAILILWIVTIWIPYLNVGTTIALVTLPLSMSKGEVISPLEIFKAKYRKYMGEFFIINGLSFMAIFTAMLFLIIPAYVISLSWSLGVYLMIDKGLNPIEALTESNKRTIGKKWTMFFSYLILIIPIIILGLIPFIGHYLAIIYAIILIPVYLGAKAYIYSILGK